VTVALSGTSSSEDASGDAGTRVWVVCRADDRCIEAIEHDSVPLPAVQWHPEDNAHLVPASKRSLTLWCQPLRPE